MLWPKKAINIRVFHIHLRTLLTTRISFLLYKVNIYYLYSINIQHIDCYCVKGLWCCFPLQWLIFIYSMMGLLIYKYEPFWQEFSVKSLILRWPLRPVYLLFYSRNAIFPVSGSVFVQDFMQFFLQIKKCTSFLLLYLLFFKKHHERERERERERESEREYMNCFFFHLFCFHLFSLKILSLCLYMNIFLIKDILIRN